MAHIPDHLLAGYRNFMSGRYASESGRYRALAREGQAPETMVIACCDSRAAPESISDAGPGELFVVRNVANLVPPYAPDGEFHSTSAALEFAVQSLKIRNIVVMGHGRCGGIGAALNASATPLSPGDFIGKWMDLIAPAARRLGAADGDREDYLTRLELATVEHGLANLMTFPCISILVERGKLHLHGAYFGVATGALLLRDPATGEFAPAVAELPPRYRCEPLSRTGEGQG
jgi:carbonic anhydrase